MNPRYFHGSKGKITGYCESICELSKYTENCFLWEKGVGEGAGIGDKIALLKSVEKLILSAMTDQIYNLQTVTSVSAAASGQLTSNIFRDLAIGDSCFLCFPNDPHSGGVEAAL